MADLDAIDRAIIEELLGEGRLTFAELGRRVSLSPPAVAERVQRLERAGVITGYRAEVDLRALGYPLTAIVRVRPASGQVSRIPETARGIPQVIECHRITGEDCFILKVYIPAMEQLDRILDRFLLYGTTTTSIIQSSPVLLRPPPLPDF